VLRKEFKQSTINIGSPSQHQYCDLKFLSHVKLCLKGLHDWENDAAISVHRLLITTFEDSAPPTCFEDWKNIVSGMKHATLSEFVRAAVTLRERPDDAVFGSFFTAEPLAQSVQRFVASVKSMTINNFQRVLAKSIQFKIQPPTATDYFPTPIVVSVSDLISRVILGKPGEIVAQKKSNGESSDDEVVVIDHTNDVDKSMAENKFFTFKDFVRLVQRRVNKYQRKLTSVDTLFLKLVTKDTKNLVELRAQFLPTYLEVLVDGWQNKVSQNSYKLAPLVWRLFAETNKKKFVQEMFPTPNSKNRFHTLTTTRLAHLFGAFFKSNKSHAAKVLMESGLDVDAEKFSLQTWKGNPAKLWDLAFPGIAKYQNDRLKKGRDIKFMFSASLNESGTELHCLFLNRSRPWSKASYRDSDKVVDLGELAGLRDKNRRMFGPTSSLGFSGWLSLKKAVTETVHRHSDDKKVARADIKTGMEAVQSLLKHPLIIMDPGCKSPVTAIIAILKADKLTGQVSGHFKRMRMNSDGVYQSTGVAEYVENFNGGLGDLSDWMQRLAEKTGRTMGLDAYNEHVEVWNKNADQMHQHNVAEKRAYKKSSCRQKTQSFYARFVNSLFAVSEELWRFVHGQDAVMDQMPVILFGDGDFKAVKGYRAPNQVWIRDYLARFFLVLMIGEFNSSQKCPKCFGSSDFNGKGLRIKKCTAGCTQKGDATKPFIFDRDIGACMNMLVIAIYLIMHGRRPAAFAEFQDPHKCKCPTMAHKSDDNTNYLADEDTMEPSFDRD
jgi:hypothetical protein